MKLTRRDVIGYDSARMSYKFTMLQGANVVECEISSVALKELHRFKWGGGLLSMEEIFIAHQDTIEEVASRLFEQRGCAGSGTIKIFSKHIPK